MRTGHCQPPVLDPGFQKSSAAINFKLKNYLASILPLGPNTWASRAADLPRVRCRRLLSFNEGRGTTRSGYS
jgi:hypothetical protein